MTAKMFLIRGFTAIACAALSYLVAVTYPIEKNNVLINLGFMALLVTAAVSMTVVNRRNIAYGIFYGLIIAVIIAIVLLMQKLLAMAGI